jgi:hypothetical protein
MIREMALAIAEGQIALDMNSVQVAQTLASTQLDAGSVVMYIEETVMPMATLLQAVWSPTTSLCHF